MKKHAFKILSTVIIMLVLVISLGIYEVNILSKTAGILSRYIENVEKSTSTGDWKKAETELDKFNADWAKAERIWAILIDHTEIDNIDNTVSRMEKFIEAKDTPSALAETSALKMFIKHIPEKEALTLKNIF